MTIRQVEAAVDRLLLIVGITRCKACICAEDGIVTGLGIGIDCALEAVGSSNAQEGRDIERAQLASVLQPGVPRAKRSSTYADARTRHVGSGAGNDVDHAGIGIRAVKRRTRPTNDFNARDIFEGQSAP